MTYVVNPPEQVSLPVVDSADRFPVGQIYCVGRNYADHAVEMGHDPDREPPFFFIKPSFAIMQQGAQMRYPAFSQDVHHEVELVVALGRGARDIDAADAMTLVFGYAVGIDMTRRDLQADAKAKGRPWEAGKTFADAAPCSAVMPLSRSGVLAEGQISLSINGEQRQRGDINQMIWKVPEVIARLSSLFVLAPGDLIFTGTPAGVGPIDPGDLIEAGVEGVGKLEITVGAQR